ncbi:MAG TPA: TOMM precursor leader peptide-binding protein [Kofleriaceae bacterium]|nr:TOMM precursor leader peptide-binding protein [Kofleriaceae bacterium]
MDRILCFPPHWTVERIGDSSVFLIGEHERFVLSGEIYALVAAHVDGRRTVGDLIDALADRASPADVFYALTTLEERGYLVEAGAARTGEAAAFWHALGIDAVRAAARLAARPVAVIGDAAEIAPMTDALAATGVVVDDRAALRVVITHDYLDPALADLDRRARADGSTWIPVKLGGAAPWLGPVFRPADGACWACLAQRLRANRPVESFVARQLGRTSITPPRAHLPTSTQAARALAALAVARWIIDDDQAPLARHLLALELRTMRVEPHAVQRRPQCAVCGDPTWLARRAAAPIVLAARPRLAGSGGYRCVTAEETFARHAELVSPITGVVARLAPVAERDHALRPVYAGSFFVPPPADAAWRFDECSRTTLGKGRTAAEARTSALCEAIERYSAVWQGDEPVRRARWSELGDAAIHPHALLAFSDAQYRARDAHNAQLRDRRQAIPPPFDERIAIDWAAVWSLTTGRQRFVPAAYCYLGHPAPADERCCEPNSNGHAAGNCLEEAILQGFLELVERDAVSIWWHNRIARPAVDLAQLAEPYFAALEAHYRSLGFALWVLDVTGDLEIPCFVAVARSVERDRWCVGFGCHLEARLGVQRALTELNQLFEPAGTARAPWGAMADEAFLAPSAAAVPARWAEVTSHDLRADVELCVERARARGLEVLVLDQTRPDLGLHAVKVIVPGLRHFWPRLGPGRLYDVPVALGWLAAPRRPDELNPTPLYL